MERVEEKISQEKRDELEDFITSWMTDIKVPGMSLAIVKDQNLVYARGFGARDLKENLPAETDTLYGIGSCTKSFTGLAILQLVGSGDLGLGDEVDKYLPIKWGSGITIRDLLTHSSGMPSLGVAEALIDRLVEMDERGVPLSGWDDFYVHLNNAEEEIAGEPGDEFFYFNSGYELLGKIIEEVSGEEYSHYIEENILSPLNMEDSTFEYQEGEKFMTPYFIRDEGPEETSYPNDELGYASGGLMSSVLELADYVKMNMNGGKFEGKSIVDEDLLKEAHEGHVESEIGMYGYGWATNEFLDGELTGHGGSIGVASGYIGFMDDLGVALLANTSPSFSMEEIGKAVISIMKGKSAEELPMFARKSNMEKLTGKYESYRGIKEVEIEKECGLLKLTFKERLENQELILIPETKTVEDLEFYYLDGNGEKNSVRFEKEDDGMDLYIGRWRLHMD